MKERQHHYIPGDYLMSCDECGVVFRHSELRQRWDKLWVCKNDFEVKHPQESVRAKADTIRPPVIRSEQISQGNMTNIYPTTIGTGWTVSGCVYDTDGTASSIVWAASFDIGSEYSYELIINENTTQLEKLDIDAFSITSNFIAPSGLKTFTITVDKNFKQGERATIVYGNDPSIRMVGTVYSYVSATKQLRILVDNSNGAGTYTNWDITSQYMPDTPTVQLTGGGISTSSISSGSSFGSSLASNDNDITITNSGGFVGSVLVNFRKQITTDSL